MMPAVWDHYTAMRWAICSAPFLDVHATRSSIVWPSSQLLEQWWTTSGIWPNEEFVVEGCEDPQLPIGRYFERLVAAFFDRHPDWQVIDRNVVLTADGRTLGECDLIVQNQLDGQCFQIELACKYYLGAAPNSDWSNWKGRNVRDTLLSKWNKLNDQLHLFDQPAGRDWLSANGIERIQPMGFLKGYAFVPRHELHRAKLPRWHHPRQHVGWYVHLNQWPHEQGSPRQWLILPKPWWLVFPDIAFDELEPHLLDNRAVDEQLHLLFKNKRYRGWLIAQIDAHEGRAIEVSRGMVVDNTWPRA